MKNIEDLSLSTTVFSKENKEDDLLYYLETAREAGFNYVELSRKHFNLASRVQAIYDTGIKVWSIHGCLSSHAISDDKTLRRQAIDQEITRIHEAAAFGKVPVNE